MERAFGVSIIAPVFNGAGTLVELHQRLSAALEGAGWDFEILFVDDASSDDSWRVIRSLAARHPEVRGIRLARNVRQTRAIFAGVSAARPGHHIVVMDSDLEDPPEAVPELLERFAAGHDLVLVEHVRPDRPLARRLASRLVGLVSMASGTGVRDVGSSFLVSDRALADDLLAGLHTEGAHLMLPSVVGKARAPTTVKVQSPSTSPSGYDLRAFLTLAAGFVRTYFARRLSVVSLISAVATAVAGPATGGRVPGRTRRLLALAALAQLVSAAALHRWAAPATSGVSAPLFEICETTDHVSAGTPSVHATRSGGRTRHS